MVGTLRPLPDIYAICLSEVDVTGFSSIQKSNDPLSCRKYSCRSRSQVFIATRSNFEIEDKHEKGRS